MSTETPSTEMHPDSLKLITALVHPHLEGRVVRALHDMPEFPGFSLVEVRGQGRGRGAGGTYVASEFDLTYQCHLRMEIVCRTSSVDAIISAITAAAWTGRRGDGVVFVTPVERFARVRESGAAASGGEAAR